MSDKIRIAVLVSGGGTNLQALIDAQAAGVITSGEIALVVSNKSGVYALERAARAGAIAAALHEEYLQSCVGKTFPVLFEQPGAPGFYTGHAPNYMEVEAPGKNLHNCLRPVRITGVEGTLLKGEIEP